MSHVPVSRHSRHHCQCSILLPVFCREAGFAHISRYISGLLISPNKTLQGVYSYFRRWRDDGTWVHIHEHLRMQVRVFGDDKDFTT